MQKSQQHMKKKSHVSIKVFYYFYCFNLNFNWIFIRGKRSESDRERVGVVILENRITIAKSHQMKKPCRAGGRRKKNVIFPGAKATNVFRLLACLPIVLKTLQQFLFLFLFSTTW